MFICVSIWGMLASSVTSKHTNYNTYKAALDYGETNPVTVSGNVSAPARCNLDSAEGESPRLQNQCFFSLLSIFCLPLFCYFIYKWHTVLVTGLPYQWLTRAPPPNPPWPPERVPWMMAHSYTLIQHTHKHRQYAWKILWSEVLP